MKLTIVGATGGVGAHLLDQAVAANHDVTAVVRNPSRLPTPGEPGAPARVVTADLTSAAPNAAFTTAIAGADAVLSALGPRHRSEDGVVSLGTRRIVDAMQVAGVRRLVLVSVAGIAMTADDRPDAGAGWFTRTMLSRIARARLAHHYADIAETHRSLRHTDLDWTTVGCPLLTNGPATGRYRTALDQSVRGGWRITRADAATCLLATLNQADTVRHCVAIAH
ncbi:NAD(P)-binding oxidoreductase [Amycolatopsis sp. NPDC051371]|uniref:NAD(P)-dependent oxidoreductase n=1 Tax=Amycolatopsis sp. NPDC051371 TaxID=3155800 RepID=UPI00342C729C